MTLEQAKHLSLKVLKQVMEEKLDFNNVQLAVVSEQTGGYKILNREELKPVIEEVERVEKEKEEERLKGTTATTTAPAGGAAAEGTTGETSA